MINVKNIPATQNVFVFFYFKGPKGYPGPPGLPGEQVSDDYDSRVQQVICAIALNNKTRQTHAQLSS